MATKDMSATLSEKDVSPANGHRAVLIAGATASGKSALAIELARRWNGVVINADSMQLYRELSIITARPPAEDLALAPHRLYGVLGAETAFSTGEWLRMMAVELDAVRTEGKLPILVGGTGLYFKALTEGFADIPEIDPEIRSSCRQLAEDGGVEAVRTELAPLDPVGAETLQDQQRLTRALEVVRSTGKSLSDWQAEAQGAPLIRPQEAFRIVLAPPRPWLHARIEKRAGMMLSDAGIAEVRALLELGLPDSLPVMRAIGVKEVAEFLSGFCDLEEAGQQLTIATRQYAKRQETWFRNQMADWKRLDPAASNAVELATQLQDI
ncbi:tRNA (adenosine(37)-N6)-dimethylallyltransferase MiaA [Labrenzia sp. CE80]|uniref:tRNA (adenosine(37)-N6)-dimethylallyltransferase MiaA n=1 Tax=Labrenzia sp. CE80 TaxID=1788986 RepID=UPI003369F584